MITRYRNPDNHNDMVESATGEYVRFEDYQRLQTRCTSLEQALQPLADKWLYPDDLGEDMARLIREDDFQPTINEATLDECWIKRAWIRAARLALGL